MTCSSCCAPSTASSGSRSSSSPTTRWSASRSAERSRSATGGRAPRRSAGERSAKPDTTRHRRGVRRARPGRATAAATSARRGARSQRAGPARARRRPHRDLARRFRLRERARAGRGRRHVTATARPSEWAGGEDGPVVEVVDLVREFSTGSSTIRAVDGITFTRGARRAGRHPGPVGLGQDDAALADRRHSTNRRVAASA